MWMDEGPNGLVALIGPPILVMFAALLLHTLPNEVLMVLMGWTLGSVPIGVLIGHCVLNEQ